MVLLHPMKTVGVFRNRAQKTRLLLSSICLVTNLTGFLLKSSDLSPRIGKPTDPGTLDIVLTRQGVHLGNDLKQTD